MEPKSQISQKKKAQQLVLRHYKRSKISVKIDLFHKELFLELNLEREFCLALRLSPDDKGEEETHYKDDAEGYNVPQSSSSLHGQYTERQDQHSYRRT